MQRVGERAEGGQHRRLRLVWREHKNAAIPAIRLYNTDVKGIELAFEHSYRARGMRMDSGQDGEAVIIGNGNTATSALAACTEMPHIGHVTVVARHPDKNEALEPLAESHMASAP